MNRMLADDFAKAVGCTLAELARYNTGKYICGSNGSAKDAWKQMRSNNAN